MWELLGAQRSLHIRWIILHVHIYGIPPFLLSMPGLGTRVLCMLGKPSTPELHPEFLETLAFMPSLLCKEAGMGECLDWGSREM